MDTQLPDIRPALHQRLAAALGDLPSAVRLAARRLAASPGFTVAAVLCLSLAIGASTALYSIGASLLTPHRQVERPDRLVRAYIDWSRAAGGSGLAYGAFSYPDFADLRREGGDVLAGLAVATPAPLALAGTADGGGRSERLWGALVSAEYFEVLGVEMARGRGFERREEGAGAAPVAVLSHRLWQRRFAGRPIVGRQLRIGGRPVTVIGVAPEGFDGASTGLAAALWLPVGWRGEEALTARGSHWLLTAVGRLAEGATVAQAQAALDGRMVRLAATYPESNTGKAITLQPEARAALHPAVRGGFVGFLGLLAALAGLILLLACANVAALILERALGRRREMALRLALGASRGRLVGQLLVESLLLAATAGVAGLGLALVLVRLLSGFEPPLDLPIRFTAELDAGALAVNLALTAATALLFGLLPALRATDPAARRGHRGSTGGGLGGALSVGLASGGEGRRGRLLRRLLVGGQAAFCTLLLVLAALGIESLAAAREVEVGFEPEGQLIASIDAGIQGYSAAQADELFDRLRQRVTALPGVMAAGYGVTVPLSLRTFQTPVLPQDFQPPAGAAPPNVGYNVVGPGYFAALGAPLLAGRELVEADRGAPLPPLLVNRRFVERFWGEGAGPAAALGRRVEVFGAEHRVVGVVADGKYFQFAEAPQPHVFLPLTHHDRRARTLHVRTAGDPRGLIEPLRRELAALDPELPLHDLEPMRRQLAFALLPSRLAAGLAAGFGLVALLLATAGVYGLINLWVRRGRREIGIRLALGARRDQIVRRAAGQGLLPVAVGLLLGLAAGLVAAASLAGLLHGGAATRPAPYLAAAALLLLAALAAALVPAWKAASGEPAAVLRE